MWTFAAELSPTVMQGFREQEARRTDMNEGEFRIPPPPGVTDYPPESVDECLEGHHSKPFDLAKALEHGCLAGDRPARIVCTDRKGGKCIVALADHGEVEDVQTFFKAGNKYADVTDPSVDLRNFPEAQTVKVTLWRHPGPNGDWNVTMNAAPNMGDAKPYGPPVTVTFPKGEG